MDVPTATWTATPIPMKIGPRCREPMRCPRMEHNGPMVTVTATVIMRLVLNRTNAQPRRVIRPVHGYPIPKIHSKTPNFHRMDAKTRMVTVGLMLPNPMEWTPSKENISILIETVWVQTRIKTTTMRGFKPNRIIATSISLTFETYVKAGERPLTLNT